MQKVTKRTQHSVEELKHKRTRFAWSKIPEVQSEDHRHHVNKLVAKGLWLTHGACGCTMLTHTSYLYESPSGAEHPTLCCNILREERHDLGGNWDVRRRLGARSNGPSTTATASNLLVYTQRRVGACYGPSVSLYIHFTRSLIKSN